MLRGSASEKILARGHDSLPVYGAGKERPKNFWTAFIRQVVASGYLSIDVEGYGGLQLTEKAEPLLKGEQGYEYRDIPRTKATGSKKARAAVAALDDADAELLAGLKALRRELAQERKVPAYVIFSDATLHDMCVMKPNDLETSGAGERRRAEEAEGFRRDVSAGAEQRSSVSALRLFEHVIPNDGHIVTLARDHQLEHHIRAVQETQLDG